MNKKKFWKLGTFRKLKLMENDEITDYTYSNLMEWFNEFEAHTKKERNYIEHST